MNNHFKNYQNIKLNEAGIIKDLLKRIAKVNGNKEIIESELINEDEKRIFNFINCLKIELDDISSVKSFKFIHHKDEPIIIDNPLKFEIITVTSGPKKFILPTDQDTLNQLVQLFSTSFKRFGMSFLKEVARSNDIYWYGYTRSSFINGQVIFDEAYNRDANEKFKKFNKPIISLNKPTNNMAGINNSKSQKLKRKFDTLENQDQQQQKQQHLDDEIKINENKLENVDENLETVDENEKNVLNENKKENEKENENEKEENFVDVILFDTDIGYQTPIKKEREITQFNSNVNNNNTYNNSNNNINENKNEIKAGFFSNLFKRFKFK
ncbi:hypothetical protein ACTFIU_004652 [Dictyostelium citrinum]